MIHDLNKKVLVLVLLVSACFNKQQRSESTKKDPKANLVFDFKYDKVKMFHFNSYNISNNMLFVISSCRASEINFLADVSILNRLLSRNRDQIIRSEVDSIILVVEYDVHGGDGMIRMSTKDFLKISPYYDETKVNYYNKVADLMYSDTCLYSYTNELALHIHYQLHGNKNIFDSYRNFDCFDFFMKVSQELMRDDPEKFHYDAWKRVEAYLKKNRPGIPVLKRVEEISEIFAMDIRNENRT